MHGFGVGILEIIMFRISDNRELLLRESGGQYP